MKPGHYFGLSEAEYDRIDAVRRSDLNYLCDGGTPAHLQAARLWGRLNDDTDAKLFGVAYHMCALEPDRLEKECVEMIEFPGGCRSNADKAKKAEWLAENSHKIIVPATDKAGVLKPFDVLRRMRDKLWSHALSGEMLRGQGKNEVTLVWEDPPLGPMCKARIDRITSFAGKGCLLDLKTSARGISLFDFQRSYANYNYHRQAAFYLRAAEAVFGMAERSFFFLVQESVAPYEVMIYEADTQSIEIGIAEIEEALRTYLECSEKNEWPGFPAQIVPVSLPAWRISRSPDLQGTELL